MNCFWLVVPVLLWNLIFTLRLTQEGYRSDARVAKWVLVPEIVLRIVVLGYPLFLPLQFGDLASRIGLVIYLVGLLVYFGSWIPVLKWPEAGWSKSAAGVLAPHYTPLLVFASIGLIGHSWVYLSLSVLFVAIHTLHGVQSFGLWKRRKR
jgi:hypothetical protein